jgi:Tol biopolymer transport system component
MTDLREMFREATDPVAPGTGALDRQHRRQRQRRRRERGLVFGVTSTLTVAFLAVIVATRSSDPDQLANDGTPPPVGAAEPSLYEVDGTTGTIGALVIHRLAPEPVDVSPDGSRIVFVRSKGGHDQLFIANVDGTDIHPITAADDVGCGCGVHEPDWAPDGHTIAFRGADLSGNQDIYVVDIESGRVTRVTRSPALEASPDWAPDGTTIAFTRGDGDNASIWLIGAREGSRAFRLTEGSEPAWSPDGQTIAFTRAAGSDSSEIWTIRTDGSSARKLVDQANAEFDSAPAWSPDGTGLAFTVFRQGEHPPTAVAIVDLRTGTAHTVAKGLSDPAWTRDGPTLLAWRT